MLNNLEQVWNRICQHEGEIFQTTARKKPFTYIVKEQYILINNDTRRRITKNAIQKALGIANPTPSRLQTAKIWGPSYVCGILADHRII